jgi:hypothetical protein
MNGGCGSNTGWNMTNGHFGNEFQPSRWDEFGFYAKNPALKRRAVVNCRQKPVAEIYRLRPPGAKW